MKTKNILYILILLSGLLVEGCKKSEPTLYDTNLSAVYFQGITAKDSITYSFVGKTGPDTVFVPVQLMGNAAQDARKIKVNVNPAVTTAKEGTHYEKLKDYYTLSAGKFNVKIPIILYRTDPLLTSKYFSIGLMIVDSEDLTAGFPTYLNARISFTNQLIKPTYWDAILLLYFGEYSKVKHAKCIELMKRDFPLTQGGMTVAPLTYAFWMSWGRVASDYFIKNVVIDENGNRIMPWSAF